MANPQQPELARSRKTPHQDQDSVAAVVDGQRQIDANAPRGPVPPENQPGNRPAQEQDKPDLDAFAERFGIVEGEGGPAGSEAAALTERGEVARSQVSPVKVASVALAGVVFSAIAILLGRKLRRHR